MSGLQQVCEMGMDQGGLGLPQNLEGCFVCRMGTLGSICISMRGTLLALLMGELVRSHLPLLFLEG